MKIGTVALLALTILPMLYICYGMITDIRRPLRYCIPAILWSALLTLLVTSGVLQQ